MLSLLDYGVSQPKGRSGDCVQKLIILDDYLDADLLGVVGEACDWIEVCMLHRSLFPQTERTTRRDLEPARVYRSMWVFVLGVEKADER